MASIVEDYMDGSDNNDDVFPCKGCGEVRSTASSPLSLFDEVASYADNLSVLVDSGRGQSFRTW